jgi:hypothetical protein
MVSPVAFPLANREKVLNKAESVNLNFLPFDKRSGREARAAPRTALGIIKARARHTPAKISEK